MSCFSNSSSEVNQTFIIEPLSITGGAPTLSACTALFTNNIVGCDFDTEIMLLSGATVFNTQIVTSEVNLGMDSSGITRILTANLSIFNGDILNGGTY